MDSFEMFLGDARRTVRLTATGNVDYPILEKMVDTARKTAVETGYNILYDVRRAQTEVAIGNWFFIPRNLEIFKDSRAQKAIAVILASEKDKGVAGYKFYAAVVGNLGFRVRVFYKETDALNWLAEPESDGEDDFDSASF